MYSTRAHDGRTGRTDGRTKTLRHADTQTDADTDTDTDTGTSTGTHRERERQKERERQTYTHESTLKLQSTLELFVLDVEIFCLLYFPCHNVLSRERNGLLEISSTLEYRCR
jgi:hypothetical protein